MPMTPKLPTESLSFERVLADVAAVICLCRRNQRKELGEGIIRLEAKVYYLQG